MLRRGCLSIFVRSWKRGQTCALSKHSNYWVKGLNKTNNSKHKTLPGVDSLLWSRANSISIIPQSSVPLACRQDTAFWVQSVCAHEKKHGNKSFCLSVLALAGTLCDKSSWKGSGFPTLTCKATGAWRWGRWATNEECSPLWFTKSIYLTMTLRERITDWSIPCSDWCPYVFKLDAVHFAGHMCPITMEECSPLLQFLFQFRVLAMLWRQSCEHVPLWRKIWFSCQSLVPHSKHGNKSFCLLALAAARTLGDNGQLAPKCYTSGNIKQHLVDKHLMHFRSYSLTVGRARKTSNCRTWYAFELGYCRTPHITEALPLALAKRINGLNTPKNSAFHPCQHGFLVMFVSPSGVTSGKISTLDWEFQQPMNTAPCVFQFLTDKTWWKNVKGSWDLAGVKPHVFTFLKVYGRSALPRRFCKMLSLRVCVLRSPSKCSRRKPSQTNSLG